MSWPRPKTSLARLGFALALSIGALTPAAGLAASSPVPRPFAGTALWVNRLTPGQTGQQLVAEAAAAGVATVYVKAAEGSSPEPQFSPGLVSEMRSAGATVCAWTFADGQDPSAEATAAVAVVHDGAQCLVVDAEAQYDKLYGAAQLFVRMLRSELAAGFPIGLASEAEVSQHPTFPYSVFLGPGGFNVVLPLMYWLDFGVSVDAAYASAIGGNSIYARPILPVGQLYGSPTPAEVLRFRTLAHAYGAPGLSFFDLDSAQPEALAALHAPLPGLARRALVAPTLHAGACGDAIVQAQELLNAAGAQQLPVGGFFGAETARAVASFQAHHRLPPSGVLGPATWRALLHLHPREPSWTSAPPACER
ncbi:MAG: peptidoglycan-binding protein [Solirubrobacteraceae bacterium]